MGKRLLWSFRDKTRRKKFCKRNVLYLIYSSIFTSKHCNIRATLVQRNELTVFIETLKYYFISSDYILQVKTLARGFFEDFDTCSIEPALHRHALKVRNNICHLLATLRSPTWVYIWRSYILDNFLSLALCILLYSKVLVLEYKG